ncbi:MAG: isoprenylcysteine carboxylmethyltransferase family protein, partial [Verrucomicrobiota bacterium]
PIRRTIRRSDARQIVIRALIKVVVKQAIIGLLLFGGAESWNFWEAWVFFVVFCVPQLMMVVYFSHHDPELLARRLKGRLFAETRIRQRIIMLLVTLFFILTVVIPGLDHRFNWSRVPASVAIAADVAVVLGFFIQFQAFQQNSFASALIEIADRQEVISTGPYAIVRHPMYVGALIVNFAIPIALGSWWGLAFVLPIVALLILRLLDEEKLLGQSLPAYDDYCRRVRYRLVPKVW